MVRVPDGVQLASSLLLADITDAVGVASFDYRTGAVPEFSFPAVDRDRELSRRGMLREGTTLTVEGVVWQVAAVERDYKGDDIWLTFTARSRLSRRLRNMTSKHTVEKATPGEWITSQVKKAGGTAVVEPGAGRIRIVQKRNQTVLDVIAAIASDTGVEWVEVDGVIYVGTPWWAYQGNTGLPTWNARMDGRPPDIDVGNALSVVSFSSRSSLDDRKNAAEASMSVEVKRGAQVRPWHLVNVLKADGQDNGVWLVDSVSFDEVAGAAQVGLQRPLKSSPKKASQGTSKSPGSDGTSPTLADLDVGKSGWIQGADKVWPKCTRTPKQAVAWALTKCVAPNNTWGDAKCLQFVSVAFDPSRPEGHLGGSYARYVWEHAPASAVKSAGDTSPPAGAVVVWGNGTAGHIGISIGGGKMVNASGGKVFITDIAGFTSNYFGAMTPSF